MKNIVSIRCLKTLTTFMLTLVTMSFYAQVDSIPKAKSDFWKHVQFGGALGLAFGNEFTDITIAPSAIYNFNEKFALGTGLQYSYLKQRNFYTSNLIGMSVIGLFNPIREVQLSLEVEQMNVSNTFQDLDGEFKENFWNTGLFFGAGYRNGNVTIGGRYNLLFNKNRNVYGEAFMPFVRVFF